MKVVVLTGSRADKGLLDPVYDELSTQGVDVYWRGATDPVEVCDCVVLLGDRHEVLHAAIGYYRERIPIAHLCGGDTSEGSYDEGFRDCLSRLATWHFVTNAPAASRLAHYGNVHLVGSTGADVLARHKTTRPLPEPYVLVSYQPETATGANRIDEVLASLPADKVKVLFLPNDDTGSQDITRSILRYEAGREAEHEDVIVHRSVPHALFLDLLAHCDEFIGNSSAMLYEAPFYGVKTRMVGDRQKGRVAPILKPGASRRISEVLIAWFKQSKQFKQFKQSKSSQKPE